MEKDKCAPGKGKIGKYRLLAELGKGATARVFQVEQPEGKEVFALKYGSCKARLRAEAAILKQLRHPCFPRWIDEGEDRGGAYLVMEYIPGLSLQRLMEQYPMGMPEQAGGGIALDVAAGLAYLHACEPSCIYRDLKASNVLITPRGRARLVDLGAALRLDGSSQGDRAGTYGYGAPEQFWEGAELTPSCDVYGFGKLLAYLLTGQDPGKPPYDTLEYCGRHSGIGREFRHLLDRCLQPDPQLRYPNASFLMPVLERLLAGKNCFQSRFPVKKGNRTSCRYIKCIWKSEYERIF
ncbi:MAG: serine/threonine protein kinase [Lachnospiraceae bacterium]|nr:serine/threonine protein kinase [Lachnospiraceae bacterium]